MANNINVTLDANNAQRVSVADNGGQNQISKGPGAQTISWNLTGPLAQGYFVPLTDAEPGFDWIQQPPAGIFSQPTISANGNSLSIQDTHTDSSSNGSWIYVIRIVYQGKIYSTTFETGVGGTVNNPVIINKGP